MSCDSIEGPYLQRFFALDSCGRWSADQVNSLSRVTSPFMYKSQEDSLSERSGIGTSNGKPAPQPCRRPSAPRTSTSRNRVRRYSTHSLLDTPPGRFRGSALQGLETSWHRRTTARFRPHPKTGEMRPTWLCAQPSTLGLDWEDATRCLLLPMQEGSCRRLSCLKEPRRATLSMKLRCSRPSGTKS